MWKLPETVMIEANADRPEESEEDIKCLFFVTKDFNSIYFSAISLLTLIYFFFLSFINRLI
jgi:hypothetical protein